jgi:WD40 repeat protein
LYNENDDGPENRIYQMKKALLIIISICGFFLLTGSIPARIATSAGLTPTAVPHRARITIDNADQLTPYAKIDRSNSPVNMIWSPNNRDLAVIIQPPGEFAPTQVWMYDTQKPDSLPRLLAGHDYWWKCVAFAPDGKSIALCDADGNITVQDAVTDTVIHTYISPQAYPQGYGAVSVAFSPNGAWLVAAYYKVVDPVVTNEIILWNTVTGKVQKYLKMPSDVLFVSSLVFSPGGTLLAAIEPSSDGPILLWSVPTGQLVSTLYRLKLDRDEVSPLNKVSFSYDGRFLIASENEAGYSFIWDRANGNKITVLEDTWAAVPNPVQPEIAYSTGGPRFMPWYIFLQTLTDKQTHEVFSGPNAFVTLMAYSPDGKKLAFSTDFDNTLEILDLTSGNEQIVLQGLQFDLVDVRNIQGTNKLATFSTNEGTLRFWDIDSGQGTGLFRCCLYGQYGSAISGDGKLWAYEDTTDDGTGSIYIRDLSTGKEIANFGQAHDYNPFSMAFSPNNKILAAGGTFGEIRLWDIAGGKLLGTLSGHDYGVTALEFSPDGKILVSSGGDSAARSWDVQTLTQIAVAGDYPDKYNPLLSISADRKYVLSRDHNMTLKLWDIKTGDRVLTGQIPQFSFEDAAFSPDGSLVAGVSGNDTLIIWDIKTGRTVRKSMPDNQLNSVVFNSDGTVIAVGGRGTLWLWSVPTQEF